MRNLLAWIFPLYFDLENQERDIIEKQKIDINSFIEDQQSLEDYYDQKQKCLKKSFQESMECKYSILTSEIKGTEIYYYNDINRWNIGETVFLITNYETQETHFAVYYPTENVFMDFFDDTKWFDPENYYAQLLLFHPKREKQ